MSAQVNFRTSEILLADIDKLVAEGHFRTRTEAVNEALRMLIQRYRGQPGTTAGGVAVSTGMPPGATTVRK